MFRVGYLKNAKNLTISLSHAVLQPCLHGVDIFVAETPENYESGQSVGKKSGGDKLGIVTVQTPNRESTLVIRYVLV